MDPALLASDFYTTAALDSPKVYFAQGIAQFLRITGNWYVTLTALQVIVQVTLRPLIYLLLVALGAWWGIRGSTTWNGVKFGAVLLLLLNHSAVLNIRLAGWSSFLSLPYPVPMIISIWLCLISAILMLIAGRVTSICFGLQLVATLIHPVLSICCWGAWGALLLPKASWEFVGSFLLQGIGGTLVPAVIIGWIFKPLNPLSAHDYIAWYVFKRHPHHSPARTERNRRR